MKRLSISVIALLLMLISTTSAAATWNFIDDYSTKNNPNGVWSYGRTWDATVSTFNVFGSRFYGIGNSGWYLGGGTWQPSISDGGSFWSNKNSDGYPVIRWTAPEAGLYQLTGSFTVSDSRGGDSFVYVTVNNSIQFTDRIIGYKDTADYDFYNLYLTSGSTIDLVAAWGGSGFEGWVGVNAEISTVPLPPAGLLMGAMLPGLFAAMRPRKKLLS